MGTSTPQVLPAAIVYGYIYGPDGNAAEGIEVWLKLDVPMSTPVNCTSPLVALSSKTVYATRTDSNGFWQLSTVVPTDKINPANALYTRTDELGNSFLINPTLAGMPIIGWLDEDIRVSEPPALPSNNGLIRQITSVDTSIAVTSPTGPVTDLSTGNGVRIYKHAGDPNGVVTAHAAGDVCIDTTSDVWYVATGAGTAWTVQVTGAVSSVTGDSVGGPNHTVEATPTTGAVIVAWPTDSLLWDSAAGTLADFLEFIAQLPGAIAAPWAARYDYFLPTSAAGAAQYITILGARARTQTLNLPVLPVGSQLIGIDVEMVRVETDGAGIAMSGGLVYVANSFNGVASGAADMVTGLVIDMDMQEAGGGSAINAWVVNLRLTRVRGQGVKTAQLWLGDTTDNSDDLPAGEWAIVSLNPQPSALSGKLYPANPPGGIQQVTGIYGCTGVPNNADGANGDWCFSDNGHQYFKAAGAWGVKV